VSTPTPRPREPVLEPRRNRRFRRCSRGRVRNMRLRRSVVPPGDGGRRRRVNSLRTSIHLGAELELHDALHSVVLSRSWGQRAGSARPRAEGRSWTLLGGQVQSHTRARPVGAKRSAEVPLSDLGQERRHGPCLGAPLPTSCSCGTRPRTLPVRDVDRSAPAARYRPRRGCPGSV
jgi:hypothetical protein